MKTYKLHKEQNEIDKNKNTCNEFLSFVTNHFSKTYGFVKVYNDSENYDDYDEIFYVFDSIDNDVNSPESALQFIIEYMKEVGWYDINFEIAPMMENNKLYVYFVLGHSYVEMEEVLLKHNKNKFNI